MTATVISIDSARRRARPVRCEISAAARKTVKDALTQEIMAEYSALPWPIVEEAIDAASAALDAGVSFLDAIEASERVLVTHHPLHEPGPGQKRLDLLIFLRARRHRMFFSIAASIISKRLHGSATANEEHYAIMRARRVIDGGGSIGAAIYQALGEQG